MVVGRTKEGCRQKWIIWLLKLTGSRQYVAEENILRIYMYTYQLRLTSGGYRMTEEDCRQKWKLDWAKFKRKMLKSTDC